MLQLGCRLTALLLIASTLASCKSEVSNDPPSQERALRSCVDVEAVETVIYRFESVIFVTSAPTPLVLLVEKVKGEGVEECNRLAAYALADGSLLYRKRLDANASIDYKLHYLNRDSYARHVWIEATSYIPDEPKKFPRWMLFDLTNRRIAKRFANTDVHDMDQPFKGQISKAFKLERHVRGRYIYLPTTSGLYYRYDVLTDQAEEISAHQFGNRPTRPCQASYFTSGGNRWLPLPPGVEFAYNVRGQRKALVINSHQTQETFLSPGVFAKGYCRQREETPILVQDYTAIEEGYTVLYRFDQHGKQRWRRQLDLQGTYQNSVLDAVVYDGGLFLYDYQTRSESPSKLLRVDLQTGKILWSKSYGSQ